MKKVIVNYAAILSGLAIAAFGVVAFVLPQGIMIGGTTGIGRILYYFYGIPVSYTVGAVNIILFSIGAFILGKKFALSVVVSTFAYPAFINLFEHMDFLAEISDDGLLSAIFGGVIVGCGLGIVIKFGASTGGSDIIAIILNRKFNIPVGPPIYIIDFSILILQIFFARGTEEILWGILLTFLYSLVADKVVVAGGGAVQLVIISKKYEQIRRRLQDIVIGTTVLYGESGYLAEPQHTLLCVISGRELNRVQNEILTIDAEAFIIINQVKEVKGRGFSFEVGKAQQLRAEKARKKADL